MFLFYFLFFIFFWGGGYIVKSKYSKVPSLEKSELQKIGLGTFYLQNSTLTF